MWYNVVDKNTMLAARRSGTIEEKVPYMINGEMKFATKKIVNGEMVALDLAKPVGEMLTTPDGLDALVQKTRIDMELGREQIPLLYGPIYRNRTDRNFSKNVDIKPFTHAQVVFLEHAEGADVKFGSRTVGSGDTVPIVTYAAGLEWTEDMVEFDETWNLAQASAAFGEAYNALLNHLHLGPIISYGYASKNQTAAATGDTSMIVNLRNTIRAGLKHAGQDRDAETLSVRKPTILLAASSRRMDIEEALQRMQINGTIWPQISQITTLIFYDGHTFKVGDKTITYPGVADNKAYLIDPQVYFWELVKHDLILEATGGDIKRLVKDGLVGRARRGVIASPDKAVEELTLPV